MGSNGVGESKEAHDASEHHDATNQHDSACANDLFIEGLDEMLNEDDEEEPYEWDDTLRWQTPRTNQKGHLGTLKVVIVGAYDLKPRDLNDSAHPYIFVSVGGQRLRSPTVPDNCNPEWNCIFCFVVREEHLQSSIDFTLRDDDREARARDVADRFLGQFDIPLSLVMQTSPYSIDQEALSGIGQGTL